MEIAAMLEATAPKELKSYSDSYLYAKYPKYEKTLMDAIMKDPLIDKTSNEFQDVIYEVKRMRMISEPLVRILTSKNTMLLDCDNPLPRTFKVFASRDPKSKDTSEIKIFIDCTNVIERRDKTGDYKVDDVKLLSYLMNGAICMVYHKNASLILRRSDLIQSATTCFAKLFTFIIDYLAKVSIQESNKIKVLYLSAMYFLEGMLRMDNPNQSSKMAKKIAGISEREANMIDILLDKACNSGKGAKQDPYENIKVFISTLADVMHLNDKVITLDTIVEKWMQQYGPGTVFGMEYFPAFSAMITDAYNGGYLNQQKTIEKVCGTDMVDYAKQVISLIGTIA